MNNRPLLTLAALAAMALPLASQQPAPAQQPAPPATAPAPVERRPPQGPGTGPGGPRGQQDGPRNFRRAGARAPGHRQGAEFHRGGPTGEHRGMMAGGFGGGFHGGPGGGVGGGLHMGPPGMWWKNPAIVTKLTLTPDQAKKMDDIFQASRLRLVDLHANVEKQDLMLQPMLSANPVDQVKTLAQIDKVAQARADLEKENAKMLLGIRGVLTPDQWTKLNTHTGPDAMGPPPAGAGPGGPGNGPGNGGPGGGGPGGGGPGAGGPGGRRGQRAPADVEMDDTRP